MRKAPVPTVGYLLLTPSDAGDDGTGVDWPTLLDALGRHSPTVEADPPDGCWLDLRGGKRSPALAEQGATLLTTARELGYGCSRLGLAPTPGVARLAARWGAATPTVLAPAAVAAFLAPLPVATLGLAEEDARRLALVGLDTLGQVAALPRGSLGDYLGAVALPVEAVARGADDRPLAPVRPPLVLEARRVLDFALVDHAQLDALLGRLLARLLADLARRGLGATRVRLTLGIAGGKPLVVEAPLPTPTTELRVVLGPLRAALPCCDHTEEVDDEAAELGGVTAVTVELSAPRPLVARQLSIFDVPTGRAAQLQLGVRAARRRGGGRLGHWEPADPDHPLPERRYAFVADGAWDEGVEGS